MPPTPESRLVDLLRQSRRIFAFTGAGISTNSGIPDYRGPQGVWKTRQPVYYDEFMSSKAAQIEYWDFKLETWDLYRTAKPNPAHHALARLEAAGRMAGLVTQNIDGLHEMAGTSRSMLVEIHGTDRWIACQTCGERSHPEPHFEAFRKTRIPPHCPCGGLLKPATISFGQNLREDDLRRASEIADIADLVLALGSTLSVYPAAHFPLAAVQRGIPYVIINRGQTEHDGQSCVTLRLEGDVAEILAPAVEQALS